MVSKLEEGLTYVFRQPVTGDLLVPALLPGSPEFRAMPEVLATGYMVGLIELACIRAIHPFLNWPAEQTVGIHVDLSHEAATPPGLELTIRVKLATVEGRKLTFEVEADDGVDIICRGIHERFIIYPEKFNRKVADKLPAGK